jgi:Flp pilus assembly protein TadD
MELYVAGFPGMDRAITSSILVVREGKISANSHKTFDKGYSLIYSNDTLNGMSGGAVLNNNGELVAIHGVGDRDEDGRKNGFNLGIPIERFGTVASRMGVTLNGQVAAIAKDTAPKADDYFALGAQKYEKGDYQGALSDFNKLIEIDPKNDINYNARSEIKLALGDKSGAILDCDRAIALNPKSETAYFARGNIKVGLGDRQGAINDYSQAIKINPQNYNAYLNRGTVKFELGDLTAAMTDTDRAIAINPKFSSAYNNRGFFKILNGS